MHFNTSHVSINRQWPKLRCVTSTISIHPMFLLIILDMPPGAILDLFQYIPCFY